MPTGGVADVDEHDTDSLGTRGLGSMTGRPIA